ncbi:sensor domain-containing diguanylate cyclase [Bacillus kexueae]|uniref:sensor domain-containing diguanylate cyclase n=1 Tax=Aeribacillus kexueae TaxID=2078952 RepID=UPI001FB0110B|nr:sensor domain-containing diguanylate cyclase [Bacillus kexueae]
MSELSILMRLKGLLFDYFASNQKVNDFYKFVDLFLKIVQKEFDLNQIHVWKRVSGDLYILQNTTGPQINRSSTIIRFERKSLVMMPAENKAYLFNERDSECPAVIELQGIDRLLGHSDRWYEQLSQICFTVMDYGWNQYIQYSQKHRFKNLFSVTEKLHSSMDKEEVLYNLHEIFSSTFPDLSYNFLLSHDYNLHKSIPVKDLEQELNTNEEAMIAFLSGKVQRKYANEKNYAYFPISGMQGVYGIIQMVSEDHFLLNDSDYMFIELASKAGGKALENAKLYEQSKRLINDLQLINDTSQKINKDLRISDTMEYMISQMIQSFSADEAAFIYLNDEGDVSLLPGSTPFFEDRASKMYIQFVLKRIVNEREGLFIGNLMNYVKKCKFQSLMAVPMIESENVKGFAIVLRKESYAFTFDMYKLMQSLIYHSTLAFINSMLREELENLVITDQLTKLYSRKYLDESIQTSMKRDSRGVFILVDIDNFKRINDSYGHQVGDEVICQVARIIKTNIREGDIGARWGGEELAVYLPKADFDAGLLVANRLVSSVKKQTNPNATISCGVSYWDVQKEDTAKQLFKRADAALYLAKNNGKNRVYTEADLSQSS